MNSYDVIFKSLQAYYDLMKIHEYIFRSEDYNYDSECQYIEDLECSILNLKDFIDKLIN